MNRADGPRDEVVLVAEGERPFAPRKVASARFGDAPVVFVAAKGEPHRSVDRGGRGVACLGVARRRGHGLGGRRRRRITGAAQASAHIQHPRSRTCPKTLAGLRLPRGPRQVVSMVVWVSATLTTCSCWCLRWWARRLSGGRRWQWPPAVDLTPWW